MTVYDLESIDPAAVNTSHALVVDLVGEGRRVLDVGCSTGYLGRALIDRGCSVDGVEIDPEAAQIAREHLGTVDVLDLDRDDLAEALAGRTYDRIVFADVLEHLMQPQRVLAAAATLLAPGGQIVISVPNVAHGSLRLGLLQGLWEYRDTGLLDRTHIRFFHRRSIVELVTGAGLGVTRLRSTVVDPLASEVELDRENLPDALVGWVRAQAEAFDYQYVLSAAPSDAPGPVPPLERAAEIPEMVEVDDRGRLQDVAALQADVARLRRSVLTLRDHAVGAEAELGHARRERDRFEQEAAAARHDLVELRRSRSWRVGQLLVTPLSRVRTAVRGRS